MSSVCQCPCWQPCRVHVYFSLSNLSHILVSSYAYKKSSHVCFLLYSNLRISTPYKHSCTYALRRTFSFTSIETSSLQHKHSRNSVQQLKNFPISAPPPRRQGEPFTTTDGRWCALLLKIQCTSRLWAQREGDRGHVCAEGLINSSKGWAASHLSKLTSNKWQ